MCQPGNPLTCKSVCECECGGGQNPLETEWEGGEVKGVASWYYMCVCVCGVCGGVNVCVWVCMMWLQEQSVRIADVLTPRGLLLIEGGRRRERQAVSWREGKCHSEFVAGQTRLWFSWAIQISFLVSLGSFLFDWRMGCVCLCVYISGMCT